MARINYETADVLVYDPVATHRTATTAVLYTLGFRTIAAVQTLSAFNSALKHNPPDLAMCEAQGGGAELCDSIQAMRQGGEGHNNPFLVVIVTAWEKNQSLVSRVINSGADDLILRPFSVNVLKGRIDAHVERRKGFVITHDYVGPDRRSDPSRISSVNLFQAPNSLKLKAKDGRSAQEVQARLSWELPAAKASLHREKLRRDAFQICILWRLLQEASELSAPQYLAKLRSLTHSVAKRCRDTEYEGAQVWCDSVQAAVDGLHLGVDRNASMHLLGHAALSLNQLLQPETSKADHLSALERVVTMIRARQASLAASEMPQLKTGSA